MEPSRIHELNKLAGEFCGLEMVERIRDDGTFLVLGLEDRKKITSLLWEPCTDHNHAAAVKAKLKEQGYGYALGWDQERKQYMALIQVGDTHESPIIECWSEESELIALMLVIEVLGKEKL